MPAAEEQQDAAPLTANMLPYSAMKKNDQRRPLYSVWKPATSSLSASARSNGARLQLAVAQMKKMKKATNVNGSWKRFQFQKKPVCCMPIVFRFSVPGDDDRDEDAHRPRHLVADHLGRLADAAEQRPLAARGVAGQDHAEHLAGHHGEHEERGDVQLVADDPVAERQDEERDERGAEREVRGEPEQELVGDVRGCVFLDEQLEPSAIV